MMHIKIKAKSWDFFQGRIPYEEEALIKMFGDKYLFITRMIGSTKELTNNPLYLLIASIGQIQ